MARLLQKYGPQLLGQMQETAKDDCTPVSYTHLGSSIRGLLGTEIWPPTDEVYY